jgi:hypothetical protein
MLRSWTVPSLDPVEVPSGSSFAREYARGLDLPGNRQDPRFFLGIILVHDLPSGFPQVGRPRMLGLHEPSRPASDKADRHSIAGPGIVAGDVVEAELLAPSSLSIEIHCIGSSANRLSVGLAASPLSATNLTALQNLNTVAAGQKFSREYPRGMSLPQIASAAACATVPYKICDPDFDP